MTTQPEPCKHCPDRIAILPERSRDYIHVEGDQAGKHTCAVEPYGFHAEPVGAECSAHPANPCNGSRGIEVQR
ncbi:hypothetical protein A5637_13135 [Mycolicibacterium fortuitum]|uniref:hypothetical protein n=1 Tax=Mycolicibacterium fortuitum TaxID=1766 RepID=UPI0007ECEB30|nr:hypothetical protein [Mycolicibacterium fortuitum]OBK04021.1 hypothetical protein A5637_13135 [Mycolicibacterium fortuitum]